MPSKSIKMDSITYDIKSVSQCTDAEGVDCCPKCGGRTINLVHEEAQHGLWGRNRYFIFNECDTCAKHYVLVLTRMVEDYYAR